MSDQRYSLMVLPRRGDGSILLQTWINGDSATTDGFGSFYQLGDNPERIARKELTSNFGINAVFTKAAQLQYFIDKPTGMVDLKVTVFYADVIDDPELQDHMHWFAPVDIPYSQMHPATGKWLPLLLRQQKLLTATINVSQSGDHTTGKVTEFTVS